MCCECFFSVPLGAYLNLHGLGKRNRWLLLYIHKLWKISHPDHAKKVCFIAVERSPGYLPKSFPELGCTALGLFPTLCPKGKLFIWAPSLRRFSWVAPEEMFAAQGLSLELDYRHGVDSLKQVGLNLHDTCRLAGNAFHMPSVLGFAAASMLHPRAQQIGDF